MIYHADQITVSGWYGFYIITTSNGIPNTYRSATLYCENAPTIDGVPSTVPELVNAIITKVVSIELDAQPADSINVGEPKFTTSPRPAQ